MEISDFKDVENLKKQALDILKDLEKELPKLNNTKKDGVIRAFNKYFVDAFKIDFVKFNDRLPRRSFWMYVFFTLLIGFLLSLIGIFAKIFFMVAVIPLVVLAVRRIHDIDFSGFWLLLVMIPYVGLFLTMFLLALPGDKTENNYGDVVK